jgi:Ca-activated chloride channel family protein
VPIQFTNPLYLLLLPAAIAFFWWCNQHTVTDMSAPRRRWSLLLRCLLATLLVFTLAGLKIVRPGESLAVVFLVDASKSVREDQRARMEKYIKDASGSMRAVDKVGVITFASEAHLQSALGQPLDVSHLRDPGITTSTDIAHALQQARNELKTSAPEAGKRIVLLSDGNENVGITNGGALSMVRELAADHIVLDTITLPVSLPREALIDKMALPNRVKIGEPFTAKVIVSSLTAQAATVSLFKEGKPTGQSKKVDLHVGKNVVTFEQNIDQKGFFRYSATLDAPEDTIPENNKGEGFVWVEGKPTVLYVADSSALTTFLRKSLQSLNINVEYANPEAMPTSAAALQPYDSVFLSNVPASALSSTQMTALQVACRDFGVGLGMVGGDTSFGAGGYRGTPIEDALPVSMDVKKQKRLPSVAVALVIEDLEIPTTINMSIEAAKATMDLLEPIDQVGVLDCNGAGGFGGGDVANIGPGGTWRIPMQHVTDREALKAAMQNLQGMGDPPNYDPYLMEAARVLGQTDAKIKHIIFLGDGDAVWEANQNAVTANIQKIHDMGITVSTISTGADKNGIQFMAVIAKIGNGQAYVAERPQDLPRLLLKDQQTISQPPIIEEPFRVIPTDGDEIMKGIDWGGAPPLLGYDVTSLKPTASLALRNANPNRQNDPIFAGWRYGLGRSVAFMSDDRAHWGAAWLGWPGYAKFWAQAVRWTLRPFAPSEYSTQVTMEGNRGHIVVDAIDQKGHYVNRLPMRALIAPPGVGGIKAPVPAEQPLRQTGPGHYEAWFDAPQIGTYLVNVLQKSMEPGKPDKATSLGLSTSYSPEYKDTQSNQYLMTQLAQVGGGRVEPAPPSVFGVDRPAIFAAVDMIPWLLALTLPFLIFDIATRRLAIERSDFQRALAWLAGRKPQVAAGRAATPELSRLMERKEGALGNRGEEEKKRRREEETSPLLQGVPTEPLNARTSDTAIPNPKSNIPSPSRTIRPAGLDEAAPVPPPAETPPSAPEPTPEEAGMSRLMAAKRRAQQRQQEKDDA